jgi:hypothetical protein
MAGLGVVRHFILGNRRMMLTHVRPGSRTPQSLAFPLRSPSIEQSVEAKTLSFPQKTPLNL